MIVGAAVASKEPPFVWYVFHPKIGTELIIAVSEGVEVVTAVVPSEKLAYQNKESAIKFEVLTTEL